MEGSAESTRFCAAQDETSVSTREHLPSWAGYRGIRQDFTIDAHMPAHRSAVAYCFCIDPAI
jgi:hypothetical protein